MSSYQTINFKHAAIVCFFLFCFVSSSALAAPNDTFFVKPYLQLGNNSKHSTSIEIVWFSRSPKSWQCFVRALAVGKTQPAWQKAEKIQTYLQGQYDEIPYYQHIAKLPPLKFGSQFLYRLDFKNKTVFKARGKVRPGKNKPYSFAVAGDIGAGSSGQKRNVFQIHRKEPDLFLIPGDVAYNRGRISEYLSRFWPVLNADQASPKSGAPLLRSVLSVASIGNHDIALTNRWSGVNFTRYPDALGYYIFWSQPLNGPKTTANAKNTTIITGNAKNQLNFVRAAREKFPRMNNFSFDYGASHWLVLDANPYMDWTDSKIRNWVINDLKRSKAAWKFVLCHQPGFSIDNSHWIEQRMRLLSNIFEQQKVDIVFSGHAHTYQRSFPLRFKCREENGELKTNFDGTIDGDFQLDKSFDGVKNTKPNGVLYIVSGAGGAHLYRKGLLNKRQTLFNDKFINHKHSFTYCTVEPKELTLTQISCDGEKLDHIKITK